MSSAKKTPMSRFLSNNGDEDNDDDSKSSFIDVNNDQVS
jgi:hypothetical protein